MSPIDLQSVPLSDLVWYARHSVADRLHSLAETPGRYERLDMLRQETRRNAAQLIALFGAVPEKQWLVLLRRVVKYMRLQLPSGDGDIYNLADDLVYGSVSTRTKLLGALVRIGLLESGADPRFREFQRRWGGRAADPNGLAPRGTGGRLLLRFSIADNVSEDTAAEAIAEIVHALSVLHVHLGGAGLELDDWTPLVREPAIVEL